MANKSLFSVKSVAKVIAGTVTDSALTGTWSDGSRLAVEYVTDFSPTGGTMVIGTGATPETAYYSGIDEDTEELTGVTRPNAGNHAAGAFVQAGAEPSFEKVATGFFGDSPDAEVSGVPIRSFADPYFRTGSREEGAEEVVWVEMDEDDEPWVIDAPKDAAKTFDGDLEVLPSPGGGDDSGAITDPNTGKILPPPGQGWPDGIAPVGTVVAEAFGGIGNWIGVNWTTIANSTQVNYEVHVSTTTGFTPGATTLYSVHSLAGNTDGIAAATIKDFPLGHVLDGTASDPPQAGTTYYIKIVPKDESGAGTTSAQVSATPVNIGATQITDGAITTPKLYALAVTADKIAALTITADKIAASTITADKLSVTTLSAITANLGTVNAGSLSAVSISTSTITGGTIQTTSGSGLHVKISNARSAEVVFYNGATEIGNIAGTSGGALSMSGALVRIGAAGGTIGVFDEAGSSQVTRGGVGGSPTVQIVADKVDQVIGDLQAFGFYS